MTRPAYQQKLWEVIHAAPCSPTTSAGSITIMPLIRVNQTMIQFKTANLPNLEMLLAIIVLSDLLTPPINCFDISLYANRMPKQTD